MAVGSYLPIVIAGVTTVQLGVRRFKLCYWFNPANIGDTIILQDDAGNLIWEGRCEVANQSQIITFPREIEVNGFQVPTISSGNLLLYCV